MLGTYALSAGYYDAYYLKAQKVRTLLARDFEEAFRKVDAIVTPTSPTAAFGLGEKSNDPLAMYLADVYTVTADLARIPGISLPCGETNEKLPSGLPTLGRHFDETTILRMARAHAQAASDVAATFPQSRNFRARFPRRQPVTTATASVAQRSIATNVTRRLRSPPPGSSMPSLAKPSMASRTPRTCPAQR